MAIFPAKKDFTIQRRADFGLRLQFKDGDSNNMNLNGFTVDGEVWENTRTTKFADFGITYTNRQNGIVDVLLTDTQTTTFTPDELEYDFLLTDPSGKKEYYLQGTLFIEQGYTT
mgnify:FL=1|tara:strand:- start:689 stop:1030 length:342 start_codon:yes stop_codon:yes gene_type:complete